MIPYSRPKLSDFYTLSGHVPHVRDVCLVLDFSEPNCDWSKKNDVMEIICGFVWVRRDTKAGNTSVLAGYSNEGYVEFNSIESDSGVGKVWKGEPIIIVFHNWTEVRQHFNRQISSMSKYLHCTNA